jgi:hypothetical protein
MLNKRDSTLVMRFSFLLVAMIGVIGSGCSSRLTATHAKIEWMYLGIPADEEYPGTKFRLDSHVPQDKYWRVSRVRHVAKDEYESDVAAGRMLYRDHHAETQFYATELRGDFVQAENRRYWVTILERKAFP